MSSEHMSAFPYVFVLASVYLFVTLFLLQTGFCFHGGGHCVTIFSSSHYANGINDAAVALVYDSQILVIKVDTIAEQQPAFTSSN